MNGMKTKMKLIDLLTTNPFINLTSEAYDTSILYRVKLTLDKEQNHLLVK